MDCLCYLCLVFVVFSRLFVTAGGGGGGVTGLLALVCDVCCDFIAFPFCILGQVWYLIVSIPDP